MNLTAWTNWALLLSGFGAFFAGIGTLALLVIRHAVDKKFNEDVRPILDDLVYTVKELKTNGGKSIKDTVDKTWDAVQKLTKTDGEHEARLDILEKH